MDDKEVLTGFLLASRYITRDVHSRYGFDITVYTVPPMKTKLALLRTRLTEILQDNTFTPVKHEQDLIDLLGDGFEWVRCGSNQ